MRTAFATQLKLRGIESAQSISSQRSLAARGVLNDTNAAMSFRRAESLVIKNGKRLLAHASERSVALTFDWDLDSMVLSCTEFHNNEVAVA